MNPIANLVAARAQAAANHDWALVAEIDASLHRYGYRADDAPTVLETAVAPLERAVPAKRKQRL